VSHTIYIHYGGDLYEVHYSNTIISSIQKWYAGGRMVRMMAFQTLPREVQKKIVKQMQEKHDNII
jgi:hypothetical protein